MSAAIAMAAVGAASGIGLNLYNTSKQRSAAKKASQAQTASADAAIAENQRQFDEIVALMKPYVDAGEGSLGRFQEYSEPGQDAFGQQLALTGLSGPEAEREAINQIRTGEKFKILQELGQEGILNNASVTGGLRGGRTQGALAQFSPALLQDLIDEQYGRLGGITALGYGTDDALVRIGQNSAAQQGAMGQQSANTTGGLLQDVGASRAGYYMARGQSQIDRANAVAGGLSQGAGIFTGF